MLYLLRLISSNRSALFARVSIFKMLYLSCCLTLPVLPDVRLSAKFINVTLPINIVRLRGLEPPVVLSHFTVRSVYFARKVSKKKRDSRPSLSFKQLLLGGSSSLPRLIDFLDGH